MRANRMKPAGAVARKKSRSAAVNAKPEQPKIAALFAQCSRMMQTIPVLPQPVIARVQGAAAAAGCQLVAQCDLAVAAETAKFVTSELERESANIRRTCCSRIA